MTMKRLRPLAYGGGSWPDQACVLDATPALLPDGRVEAASAATTVARRNPSGPPGDRWPVSAQLGVQGDGAVDGPIQADDTPVPLPDWMRTVRPRRAGRFVPGLLVVLAAVAAADSLLSTVLALSRL